jgi:hypothetical protein
MRKIKMRKKRDLIGWDKGGEGDDKMNRYGDGVGNISFEYFL